MTTSRYSGNRRTPAAIRILALDESPSSGTAAAEVSTGRGSGGGAPSGRTSRYSGARRLPATIRILSLFEAPSTITAPSSDQSDPLPIILI